MSTDGRVMHDDGQEGRPARAGESDAGSDARRIHSALAELRRAIEAAERRTRGIARLGTLIEVYTDDRAFRALAPFPVERAPRAALLPIPTRARSALDDRHGHEIVAYSIRD